MSIAPTRQVFQADVACKLRAHLGRLAVLLSLGLGQPKEVLNADDNNAAPLNLIYLFLLLLVPRSQLAMER